jgi:hypothetical protein
MNCSPSTLSGFPMFLRCQFGCFAKTTALSRLGYDPCLAVVVGRLRRGCRIIRHLSIRGALPVAEVTGSRMLRDQIAGP